MSWDDVIGAIINPQEIYQTGGACQEKKKKYTDHPGDAKCGSLTKFSIRCAKLSSTPDIRARHPVIRAQVGGAYWVTGEMTCTRS